MLKPEEEIELLSRIQDFLEPEGCIAVCLGPHAVGQHGDARVYEPSVIVHFPFGCTVEEMGDIATRLVNTVRGVTRVLADITPG